MDTKPQSINWANPLTNIEGWADEQLRLLRRDLVGLDQEHAYNKIGEWIDRWKALLSEHLTPGPDRTLAALILVDGIQNEIDRIEKG